jgi:hypothetical protein
MNEAPGAANRFRATVDVDFGKLAGREQSGSFLRSLWIASLRSQ